jgi:hypothetical protein
MISYRSLALFLRNRAKTLRLSPDELAQARANECEAIALGFEREESQIVAARARQQADYDA